MVASGKIKSAESNQILAPLLDIRNLNLFNLMDRRTFMTESFWSQLDDLISSCELVIDRPKGSAHPKYPTAIYPVDYGYLKGTSAADGSGIDVWRGSLPAAQFDSIVCTVDADKRDAEIKLLIGCSSVEKPAILKFLNTGAMAAILIERISD